MSSHSFPTPKLQYARKKTRKCAHTHARTHARTHTHMHAREPPSHTHTQTVPRTYTHTHTSSIPTSGCTATRRTAHPCPPAGWSPLTRRHSATGCMSGGRSCARAGRLGTGGRVWEGQQCSPQPHGSRWASWGQYSSAVCSARLCVCVPICVCMCVGMPVGRGKGLSGKRVWLSASVCASILLKTLVSAQTKRETHQPFR